MFFWLRRDGSLVQLNIITQMDRRDGDLVRLNGDTGEITILQTQAE